MSARLFTPLLLGLSLAMGMVACMSAYSPKLSAVAAAVAAGEGLQLGAPAGKIIAEDGAISPVAKAGETLTSELIAELQAAGVERVRVRQFAFSRWSQAPLFGASVAGLLLGAFLVRRGRSRAYAGGGEAGERSPEKAMAGLRDALRSLDARLPQLHDAEDGMRRITDEIDDLQSTHIDVILQSREGIIAVGGLAGFAAFMSAFSVLERQINRAWSAAADDEADEACASIRRALSLVDATDEALPRG